MPKSNDKSRKIQIIAGPTASGKSALALRFAQKHGHESSVIINADSMQIYKGLPILTACPSRQEKGNIPHALYEYLPPQQVCSVARWLSLVHEQIEAAIQADKQPIIVGGTGLYLKSLITGLSEIPEIDSTVRADLTAELDRIGHKALHEKLQRYDPETATKIDPRNTQRLLRAMEVLQATGKGLSAWHKQKSKMVAQEIEAKTGIAIEFDYTQIIPDRDWLYERCDRRFKEMVEQNVLDEVKDFIETYPDCAEPQQSGITKSLGYVFLYQVLAGEMQLEEAIEKSQQQTRNYAKRQLTWLRHQMPSLKEGANVTLWQEINES